MFDDGNMYYPANFETLGAAARAGNPNRLISYNSWEGPRLTDFQDVDFGETRSCNAQSGITASTGGNGVYVAGPQQGLLQQLHDDLRGIGNNRLINDTDSSITYTGSWGYSTGGNAGDRNDDLHYTSTVGNSFSVTFTGTGISYIAPRATNEGLVDIYIDGTYQTTINAGLDSTAPNSYLPQQLLYRYDTGSSGTHTLKGVMKSGAYMQTDVFRISSTVSTDLALNKTATQSSTAFGGVPGRAVDGNTDGNFFDGSVSHTNDETNPWWQVDLGSDSSIQSIQLWNRTDCCSTRLADFYVFVSDTPFTSTSLSSLQTQAGVSSYYVGGWISTTNPLSVNRTGRYVLVELAGTNYLSLAEVQVWSAT